MNLDNAKAELIGTNRDTYEGKNIQKVKFSADSDLSEVNEILQRSYNKIKELNDTFLAPELKHQKDLKVPLTNYGLLRYGYVWPKTLFDKRMNDSEFLSKWTNREDIYHYSNANITYQLTNDENGTHIQLHNLIYNMITYNPYSKEIVFEVNPKENWDFSEVYGDSKRLSYVLEVFENAINGLNEKINSLYESQDLIDEKLNEYKSKYIKSPSKKNITDNSNNPTQ